MITINPSPVALADLAEAMRPDWNRADFEGAVAYAMREWDWRHVFGEVSRLMNDEGATPHDLVAAADAAARDPRKRPGTHADVAREWGQVCREVLAAQRGGAA
jgi:hypothetical protein